MAARLWIGGASTRAAAFSALRAGLQPQCADLFTDADLRPRCAVVRVPSGGYPTAFLGMLQEAAVGAWMYTGGLENHPGLLERMARHCPLWGNSGETVRRVRSPMQIASVLKKANIPCPAVRQQPDPGCQEGRWLVKPFAGAGGSHIGFWDPTTFLRSIRRAVYWQEFIPGESCSAVSVGDGNRAGLLGVTRQLIGEDWLHAAPFHYCGSIGPLELDPATKQSFQRLGDALAAGFGLRGLFGVDCQLRNGVPWPVEVNPRYTASVEVHEYATGLRSLALHRRVFDPDPPLVSPPSEGTQGAVVGKAILFARENLRFPREGPWKRTLQEPGPVEELPAFADIPQEGEPIKAGRPVLTFFARADSVDSCLGQLREIAADLDPWLFGR